MRQSRAYFDSRPSELVQLFVQRGSRDNGTAESTVLALAGRLRASAKLKGFTPSLEPLLKIRGVQTFEYVDNLDCDGAIHPLGTKFEDGFKIQVKSKSSSHRVRFTVAHEICHTLFYEMAPEVKFRNHEVDPREERLCNIGAAALLMPPRMLKRQAKGSGVSLESLEKLSTLFDVSLEAMLLRLRSLGIWDAELSVWHLMTNGGFSQHRLVGGKKVEWAWSEPSLLKRAWDTGQLLRGRTYLEYRDADGCLKLRAVSYELKRRRNALLALWTHPSSRRAQPKMPLFENGVGSTSATTRCGKL